jgi:alginate O-acetyltransferase complex protein AlgI
LLQLTLYVLSFLVVAAIFAKTRSQNIRQTTLLIASYGLYLTWSRWFVLVLLGSTVMNFFLGRLVRRNQSAPSLVFAIVANVALLCTFKYLPEEAVRLPFSSLQRFAHLALPLGMSFWTFQAMSYLFDQYRGEELDPTLVEFAIYMAFFPVVISGPVCRMPDILPQLRTTAPVPWGDRERGFTRIAIGVLMMQVAKLLGHGVLSGDGINSGFDRLTHWTGPDVWCLAFGYGLQLFLDFAGYSHIAIGAAKVLGITVPENFDRPFESTSPSIFWTRWHMSLSFWIRDYVFLPLATMRREPWWRHLALIVAMVVFGIWHKGTLLFVLWGLYHGILLVSHRLIQQAKRAKEWNPPEQIWDVASWCVTISLVSLGWIFFRANSMDEARQMFQSLASFSSYGSHFLSGSLYLLVGGLALAYAAVVATASALHGQSDESKSGGASFLNLLARKQWLWVPPLYGLTLLFLLIVNLTQSAGTSQFMYRNF